MHIARSWLISAWLPAVACLVACGDSPRPYGARTTPPPSATDAPSAPASSAPLPSPAASTPGVPRDANVETKKGADSAVPDAATGTGASARPGTDTTRAIPADKK